MPKSEYAEREREVVYGDNQIDEKVWWNFSFRKLPFYKFYPNYPNIQDKVHQMNDYVYDIIC